MTTRVLSYGRIVEDLPMSGQFDVDADTTTGLTFGFTAGTFINASERTVVTAGTVTLSNGTNWITVIDEVVTQNVGNNPIRGTVLYKIAASGGAITSITDMRGAIITNTISF